MKLFGTDGIRGIANEEPITADTALKVGKALVCFLGKKKPKIVIGKDTRLSCYMLENALTAGIIAMGGDVLLVGPMPTPAIAHLTKSFAADAGIVISASHNPSEHNGIKIFSSKGFKLKDDEEEKIEKMILNNNFKHVSADKIGKAKRIEDARGRYIEFAKNSINNISLEGLKIVLDTANGAAYNVAPQIFSELGAEVIVINNKPDGININHECGATHTDTVKSAVLGYNADCGIALDGDADRIIMVDEKGKVVNGDHIIAMCAQDMIESKKLKDNTVVVTVYSNLAFDKFIESKGGKVIRAKNGDRYVIEEMKKKGYALGGESSGHIIFFDHVTTGDGTISGLKVLELMKKSGKKLSKLSSSFLDYPQVIVNVDVKKKKELETMGNVIKAMKEAEEKLGDEGRLLVRYSGTENKCRVMVEGKSEDMINKLADNIAKEIKKEVGV